LESPSPACAKANELDIARAAANASVVIILMIAPLSLDQSAIGVAVNADRLGAGST
jgi:hypothetical protein